MSQGTEAPQTALRDLGEGLILRQATAEDTEAAAEFQAQVHGPPGESGEPFRVWTRDLMSGSLPGFKPGDFTLVEDTNTGAIVSMLNLISQTWSYGGIEVGVGRIELVSTHPDYRRRGLVRAQMGAVHELSARRGEKMQVISGIPWYYRQFGYEMAIEYGFGYACPGSERPTLHKGEKDTYRVRPATQGDIAFVSRLYDKGMRRYLVSCVRDERLWRYELFGRSENTFDERETCVVEAATGAPVGVLAHARQLWNGELKVLLYELESEVLWRDVTPSVFRYLRKTGEGYAARDEAGSFRDVMFTLSTEHSVYAVVQDATPRWKRPRAWYVRVPDVPDFIRHVTPVLEGRLASSAEAGFTGELSIGFVDYGVKLSFDSGRLAQVERLGRPRWGDSWLAAGTSDALFPGLIFLQLLFGFRSEEELEYAFPDCEISTPEARMVLNALFPKGPSHIWAIW